MGLDTNSVNWEEGEEEITLSVEYALELNYEYLTDCRIRIRIRPGAEGRQAS